MKKIFVIFIFFILVSSSNIFAYANNIATFPSVKNNDSLERENLNKYTVIQNKLFSIELPEELNGFYEIEKESDKISVYHKESKKEGFGGFAFGIKAFKKPSEHAVLPGSKKLGELVDKKGNIYDIVLKYPTDVQYDYTKYVEVPESFKKLYDLGENVDIKGINGFTYYKNQGMKGEDLYQNILKKHITAINEKWDSNKLEQENMSYMYNVIGKTDKNPLKKIGYKYYDVNVDGIDELLIGEIAEGEWKGVIYDIYTMVDRVPKHVVSGGSRDRYFVCDDSFLCNEYSSGALENGLSVFNLVENSTELFPQVNFKYNKYENSKNPYFISYSDENWENVTEETFNERKTIFEEYQRFDFIPFSKISENFKSLVDKYNPKKDYFDYSVVISEFPSNYYYTTVKINKSKERILIVTDKINSDNSANRALFYYFAKNGFVYPLGILESTKPLMQSKNYLYLSNGNENIKFYMSDNELGVVKTNVHKIREDVNRILFETIESANKFKGDFGSIAGDDIKKVMLDGFYFEYHKPQYKKEYIKTLMQGCINAGVKTQVQMYCCVVKGFSKFQ